MKSFIKAYQKYRFHHRNIFNRILHIIVFLLEIPYSLKYFKSLFFYIFFNHVITFYLGHKIEGNKNDVYIHFSNNFIKKICKESILFFTLYSPLLRLYDFYTLIN